MDIRIYKNFSKRKNSTKRPVGGSLLPCKLKEETSLEHPTFIIRMQENFESINYVYAMGHYYFVDDTIILDDNRISLQCSQDVLATFKDDIINSSQYIAYASSNYNSTMFDSRCTMTGRTKFSRVSNGIPHGSDTGMYIITVLNDANNPTFTSTYLITQQNLGILSNELMDTNIDWANFFHASFDYINAIVSCKWIPFTFSADELAHTSYGYVRIGTHNTSAEGISLGSDAYFRFKGYFDVPFEYNDFRKLSPFTELSLFIPYYGTVNIPNIYFATEPNVLSRLWYWYSLDLFTGDVSISIDHVEGEVAGTYQILNFNVGVDVPIAQMRSNVTGIMSDVGSIVGNTASIFAGNYVGGTVGAVASMVNLGMDTQNPITSFKGNMQGRSMSKIYTMMALNVITKLTIEPSSYANVIGRPIAECRKIGSFVEGSYVQTENASINIAGRTSDSDTINSMLDSGIYLE